jgi:hypothetical protein
MKLCCASVLCLLGVLGGLLLPGLYSSAHAQEKKPDEAVVATLVNLVKDKDQELERRLKASDKLAELKVKDKEAVTAVAALLAEVWPDKEIGPHKETKKIHWVIAEVVYLGQAEFDQELDGKVRKASILTQRVERLGQNLLAMGAAKAAEPTMRKALALQEAEVVVDDRKANRFLHHYVDLKPLRTNALKYLVQLNNPPAIPDIGDELLEELGPQGMEVLAQLKVANAVPKLAIVLLKSKEQKNRHAAAVALGAIGSPKGLTALKAAEAVEQDEACLDAIRKSIEMLGSGGK